jgi:KDO2-lipid IV(A) lauroyltransferase
MSRPAVEPHPHAPDPTPVKHSGHAIANGTPLSEASANFWREFLYWWAAHCPVFVRVTGPFFLWFAMRFSKALCDGPAVNARRILGPDASEADVKRLRNKIVRSAYTSIYELGRAARSTPDQLRQWTESSEGRDHYFAAREAHQGAILVTAHLGPFEVGAAALMDREPNIHVLFHHDARASFDQLRKKLRRKLHIQEAAVDDGWSIWAELRDALAKDHVVLIHGDRVMPGQRGVPVPFFDGHVLMPPGPVKLAMVSGSPIIPLFSVRTRVGRCSVTIEEPIFVDRDSGPVDANHPAMRRIAKSIERHVRARPDQWAVYERAWCEDQIADTTITDKM